MKTETKNLVLFYIGSLLISLLSAYFIWLQTSKYGIGEDMFFYTAMAQDILNKGLDSVFYSTQVIYAPLYQFLLASLAKLFNTEIINTARWFNIALSFSLSFLSILLCRKLTKNLIILFAFGLFISFSRPINLVFSHAWSEPLFIFFLLLITFSIEQTSYKRLILCGFLSALAILTRYAGVAIVPAVCLYIFIQKYELSEKIKKCFCYASIPTLTYITYLIRNYYFTKTLMGPRTTSNTTFISNCDRAFSTVALWFSGSFYFSAMFLLFVLGAFIWNYKEDFVKFLAKTSGTVNFSFCWTFVYSCFIIISTTTTALDPLDDRFMVPVFISVLLIIFSLIVFASQITKKNKILISMLLATFTICTVISFAKSWTKDMLVRKNHGAGGYNSEFWQENELIKYAREHIQTNEYIFANNLLIRYILLDHKFISYIPSKIDKETSGKPTGVTLENLISKYPHFENSYILWFAKGYENIFFSISELQSICEINTTADFPGNGSVFRVGKCKK